MRTSQVVRALLSGSLLYVAMAACSAAGHVATAQDGGGTDGDDPSVPREEGGSVPREEGGSLVDAFLDELGEPTKDARFC